MTEEKFREIIVNSKSSYRFLGAEDGYWLGVDENGKDIEYPISEMSMDYKDNCIRYLNKQKENIERGFFLKGVNFQKVDYIELVRLGCEAMKRKIDELNN